MTTEKQWFYTDSAGQQAGPVSADGLRQLSAAGTVSSATLVWSEGMAEWTPATQVPGLLPTQTTAAGNPYATPQTSVTAPVSHDDYPIPEVKRTNYGLFIGTFLFGFILFMAGFVMMGLQDSSSYDAADPYGLNSSTTTSEPSVASIVLLIVGGLSLAFGGILGLVYLHRAWTVIQPGGATTTPGKSVGFLFIPLFNLYWYFIAYWKWSQDWNRVTASHSKLVAAPKAKEGVFLAYPILNIVGSLVSIAGIAGLVMYFILMKQMCNAVNYMHDLRLSNPSEDKPGGLSLY
ncbi:DUF4339 domain-containing protein [Verrucomicrobiaceae bacterium R5-34]|uniref:DUF4339 domain-containing protein n=1 Tax=Oceaniferula flava TaxID=2800421 RepID=A0AAE2VB65_9BACT|nr:DUF4339 domain-containing protein [Oceaniferula flavus]MBK1831569.1 DUF4339 domain-containing protein [Verrucomicrobiaceae bacterium R5-34]MBK1854190.1 DUF4339 domain-containing protein [Oceaniferula flavus]MBM1135496.1 DUF4339 domain-containing protein [Oceaniferula flavus]